MKRWLWFFCLFWLLPSHAGGMIAQSFHQRLQQAEQLQQKGHYRRSLEVLQPLAGKSRSGLEKTLIQTYLAYAWLGLGKQDNAAIAARAALDHPDLPRELVPNLWLLLGQAELQRGRYGPAASAFERALALAEDETPQVYYWVAYALYQQKNYAKAIDYLQQALKHHPSPPEDWYRLLLACCLEGKRYGLGESVVKQLLARRPDDPGRWRQLAALYLERGRYHEGLAALVAAWYEGAMDRRTLLQIVRLYAHVGVPEKAARLVRSWRQEGRLPGELELLALEGDLWRMAREREQAVDVIKRVAEQGKEGRQWLVLANLYMEQERWKEAAAAAAKALEMGIRRPGHARLLMGISALRAGDRNTAVKVLEAARHSGTVMAQAEFWLRCARGERRCR